MAESAGKQEPKVSDPKLPSAAASRLMELQSIVDRQAEDEGLWFVARTCAEAYLQQELRKLHAAVENTISDLGTR